MNSRDERMSILALHGFRKYVSDYHQIGQELKVAENKLSKNKLDKDAVNMYKMFIAYFTMKYPEKDHEVFEDEIIAAIKKVSTIPFQNDLRGVLDLTVDSTLQILERLPFLRDDWTPKPNREELDKNAAFRKLKNLSSNSYLIGLFLGLSKNKIECNTKVHDYGFTLEMHIKMWMQSFSTNTTMESIDTVIEILHQFGIH